MSKKKSIVRNKNKLGVYIKLLETDVWIHKTNIALELVIEKNSKKTDKTDKQLVLMEYHDIWTYLAKKRHIVSPNQDLGITRSR
jgi:hypothetical protein